MSTTSVLGIIIRLPAEALIPLLLGSIALCILLFAGGALAEWKQRSPDAARKFALAATAVCVVFAIFFLSKCLLNQSDPNNEGTGQLSFVDAPIAALFAAVAASFARMADLPKAAYIVGVVIGLLLLAKPFVWPVIRNYTEAGSPGGSRSRGLFDPEHLEFLGTGIIVLITGLVTGRKR